MVVDPKIEPELHARFAEISEQALRALGGFNSVYHMEIFRKGEELIFLEVGCRAGGADIVEEVFSAFGVNLATHDFFVNARIPLPPIDPQHAKNYLLWAWIPKLYSGRLVKQNIPALEGETSTKWFSEIGDVVKKSMLCVDTVAILHNNSTSYKAQWLNFQKLREHIDWVTIEENAPATLGG